MESFIPFFLLLFAGVVFSALSSRLHLPWVIALIVAGITVGPSGFDVVEINPTIEFIGQVGLVFLMFMAGLETKLSSFREVGRSVVTLSLSHGIISFGAGTLVGYLFGFDIATSALIGIIFLSTSVAVVIPSLEVRGIVDTKLGKTIIAAIVLADILALILLSIVLQNVDQQTALPLPVFYATLIAVLIAMRFILPRFEKLLAKYHRRKDIFQQEIRAVLTVLLGTVIIFELLGLHAIIAGFFAGLVLSDSVTNEIVLGKLRALSYGFFIPTFFVVVGIQIDLTVFESARALPLLLTLVVSALLAKVFSGWLGAKLSGFSERESWLTGVATIPQLSTTLAVVYSAVEFRLINDILASSLIMLAIITTFVGPLLVVAVSKQIPVKKTLFGKTKIKGGKA